MVAANTNETSRAHTHSHGAGADASHQIFLFAAPHRFENGHCVRQSGAMGLMADSGRSGAGMGQQALNTDAGHGMSGSVQGWGLLATKAAFTFSVTLGWGVSVCEWA